MNNNSPKFLVEQIAQEVKNRLSGEGSGHDWWHIYRVWQMARRIGREEKADMIVVELGALLHDIADWKLHEGDDEIGPREAQKMLEEFGASADIIDRVSKIVAGISFHHYLSGKVPVLTLEGKIVQDADRLDALGAIGIARAFVYGGHANRILYDPSQKPILHKNKESYIKNKSATINHFYEKLLLLKDMMNTATAKRIAVKRHEYMEEYLKEFFGEWEGRG